jgi:prophage regulatory protein
MRAPEVRRATGYGKSSIYALMQAGKFPKPVKMAGGGAVAWRASEIQAWIAAQGTAAVGQGRTA